MTNRRDARADRPLERAEREPTEVEHDWLHATQEDTDQDTLEGAIDVSTGRDPAVPRREAARADREREREIRSRFG